MTVKFQIGLGSTFAGSTTGVTPTGSSDLPPMILGVPASQMGVIGNPPIHPVSALTKESLPSRTAFHSTLFRAFRLAADPVYNFFTPDETKTFVSDSSASLDSLPRYIVLSWRPAPIRDSFTVSQKGLKPHLNPAPPRPGVLTLSVADKSAANGYINPGVINALISASPAVPPPPVVDEDTFLFDPDSGGDLAAMHAGDSSSEFAKAPPSLPPNETVVNFIDPSIAGALDSNRISSVTKQVPLMVVGSLARLVAGMEVLSEFNQDAQIKNPPPTFPASVDSPVISYVGYVIERHTIGGRGRMALTRTIEIDNSLQNVFIDREVLYGQKYSYRIRALLQWVHPKTVDFEGSSAVDRNSPTADAVGPRVASFYLGDWVDWVEAEVLDVDPPGPPEELTVQPVSRTGEIRVAWRTPDDSKRDIRSVHLLRATVESGQISSWSELGSFVPTNGQYFDRSVQTFDMSGRQYVYAMYSTSVHGLRSTLGAQMMARLSRPETRFEHPLVQVSGPGGDPTDHPSLGDHRESTDLIAKDRMILYCREVTSLHPLRDKDYLLDVRSLSTGERTQVMLNVDSTEILPEDA